MLEVYEPVGAFERIEAWLREQGFFTPAGEALVADLYLGYGLSETIRRTASPAPPEPCPLPLAACAVRPVAHDVRNGNEPGDTEIGEWRRTWDEDRHAAAVDAVRAAIAQGRRLPGQPCPAPLGAVRRVPGRARLPARPSDTTERRAAG